jgi:hypothetical protein
MERDVHSDPDNGIGAGEHGVVSGWSGMWRHPFATLPEVQRRHGCFLLA